MRPETEEQGGALVISRTSPGLRRGPWRVAGALVARHKEKNFVLSCLGYTLGEPSRTFYTARRAVMQ